MGTFPAECENRSIYFQHCFEPRYASLWETIFAHVFYDVLECSIPNSGWVLTKVDVHILAFQSITLVGDCAMKCGSLTDSVVL